MFANSDDLQLETDEFGTSAGTQRWLHEAGLLDAEDRVREPERRQAIELRDALRELLLANHERTPPDRPAARAVLDEVARRARFEVRFRGPDVAELVPNATGVARALGIVVAAVFEAMRDGTWARMKACRNDDCHWAFYDHSRNRSGAWCQMETCGTEVKMRAYRQRQAARRR
jgi:predicted RNA-binding Zn ribbon-like protein